MEEEVEERICFWCPYRDDCQEWIDKQETYVKPICIGKGKENE
jgi:hypothetical protein